MLQPVKFKPDRRSFKGDMRFKRQQAVFDSVWMGKGARFICIAEIVTWNCGLEIQEHAAAGLGPPGRCNVQCRAAFCQVGGVASVRNAGIHGRSSPEKDLHGCRAVLQGRQM